MPFIEKSKIAASIRYYLEELQESGVEGLSIDTLHSIAIPDNFTDTHKINAKPSKEVADTAHNHQETVAMIKHSLGDCQRCKLSKTRKNIVFGAGNIRPRIVFVGEGPGADEDIQGEPFVGEAGAILTRIITAMGLSRDDVYICNVVKCRPPKNRDPEPDEIAACSPYLLRQIKALSPDVIVALGRFAAQTLLNTKEQITKIRGKWHEYNGIKTIPTYHPSYLLRNRGNSALYWDVWNDMVQVLHLLGLPVPDKKRKS